MRSFTRICAVVPRIFACTSSLNPVMIPTVPINAATPSVMPTMDTIVLKEMVRLRRLARR